MVQFSDSAWSLFSSRQPKVFFLANFKWSLRVLMLRSAVVMMASPREEVPHITKNGIEAG